MEGYLRRRKLGAFMDDLGLRTLIALAAWGWFMWLWGVGMPAFAAGLGLGGLGQLALSLYRRHTVGRREKALRQALGGEMLMEEMLLRPARQAHLQSAILLAQRYPLTLEKAEDEGMLCRSEGALVLVSCLRRASESEATREDVLACQRAARKHLAQKSVVCLTCRCPAAVRAFAERCSIPVRLISRETMLALAGQASPATDEQLVALGKRKNRPGRIAVLRRTVLNRDKAGRYLFYGTGMLIVYILTGAVWYLLPGLTLSVLASCSRYEGRRPERL